MAMETAMDPTATPDYASLYEGYTSPLEPGYDGLNWSGMKIDVSGLKLDTTSFQHKLTRNPEGVVVGSEMPLSKIKLTADAAGGMVGAMGLWFSPWAATSLTRSNSTRLQRCSDPEKDVTSPATIRRHRRCRHEARNGDHRAQAAGLMA
jgi:hypothetical protein